MRSFISRLSSTEMGLGIYIPMLSVAREAYAMYERRSSFAFYKTAADLLRRMAKVNVILGPIQPQHNGFPMSSAHRNNIWSHCVSSIYQKRS